MDTERFSKSDIDTLAKRAANICANPDCRAITTGPAGESNRSITVGEAAHIYGAKPGSARFAVTMNDADRRAITNAIWLCRNCHKRIDADPNEFSAELLFEWRREHDRYVSQQLGRSSDSLRQKILDRKLEQFKNTSYLAQQIIIDKPHAWEYRLTVELMRNRLLPILARWDALQQGLYTKRINRIAFNETFDWLSDRFSEAVAIVDVVSKILNEKFSQAWGAPGEPGSESEILRTCDFLAEACERLLNWEEDVQFAGLSEEFTEIQKLLSGTLGTIISQIFTIPERMAVIFNQPDPQGTHNISIDIALPQNWVTDFSEALKRIERRKIKRALT